MPKKTKDLRHQLTMALFDLPRMTISQQDRELLNEVRARLEVLEQIETRAAEVKTKARKVYEDTSIDAVSCLDDCADYILGKRERFALHEFHDSAKKRG
ncbi:MAG TPA: hypothetical protein PKV97_09275 [Thauera aminoaromatica]|nr:hypothetical protein [Thauera aminoaromatica]